MAELWFFSTALLHVCYQSMKFQVDSFYSLKVMAQTDKGDCIKTLRKGEIAGHFSPCNVFYILCGSSTNICILKGS